MIPAEAWPLRYAAAVVVVLVTVAVRAALAPLLGTQAPLLPFVLAVFVSAYLGGRGPALLASALTPLFATFWFTSWPHDAPPGQWAAHVVFFLLIAALATLLMHELQRSSRAQMFAVRHAADSAAQALQSAAQLRLIADAMPAVISYVGSDGIYRFTNKMSESWLGIPREQVVGRHLRDLLGSEGFELIRPRVERALAGERVFFELEVPHGGGMRDLSAHYIPDLDANGVVQGFFTLVEDVSARKRAERSLREADRRKDEFLAMLAHELRNPLTPIRNVAHILGKGTPDAATVRRSSELLERQANHLTRLVDDLLDVARITRGRVVLKREALNLATMVDTALETVRPMLEARRQTASVTRGMDALFVDADSVRLCQVVANLLTNAVKYSPEHSHVEIRIEGGNGEAMIAVRDRGVGIDAQLLPHLFELFLQGDRTLDRSQGGLGIGLTIVKHLVDMHGGRVEALSEGLGQGSEFRVWLPSIRPPPVRSSNDALGPTKATPRRRILLVEDNEDAAESMRELLHMDGHEVEVAPDGASALGKLEEFDADVVVLDIGLPRMDGYMVAHAIRARFANQASRPRLLALTGYGRDEDRSSALRSGFDGHLTKPVEPTLLLKMIAEEGQRQRTSQELR